MAASTRRAYTKNIYIDSPCAIDAWIRCTSDGNACINIIYVKSASIRGIELGMGQKDY